MISELDRIIEAQKVVNNLNNEFITQTGLEGYYPFTFVYATDWMGIKFFDEVVWDDQDNECEYIETETDDRIDYNQETVDEKVRKSTKKYLKMLKKFRV